MCYKILEKTKDFKSKLVKTYIFQVKYVIKFFEQNFQEFIFQVLGTLVKKYNHGIACVVRFVHLTKFNESLAAPVGAGIVVMATECGCTGLIKEIVREIVKSEPDEKDARNFSIFLESITSTQANLILPVLDIIMEFLENDCYVLRNCAIGVMGIIVTNVLSSENISSEDRVTRDECLTNLEDHILDCNAYVRSKVLQVWQNLCCEGAIPLSRQSSLLKSTLLRLEDKSANVRKQALQLLRAILQSNPFTSKMNQEQFLQKLEQAKSELKQLQTNVYHTVGAEETEELWKTQLPLIEKAISKIFEDKGKIFCYLLLC